MAEINRRKGREAEEEKPRRPRRQRAAAPAKSAAETTLYVVLGALGAVLAVVLIFVLRGTARDKGLDALDDAQRLVQAGRDMEALAVLRDRGSSRDQATVDRIKALEAEIRTRQGAALEQQNYQADWEKYNSLKSSGSGPDELRKELERMQALYKWHGDWAKAIHDELATYGKGK